MHHLEQLSELLQTVQPCLSTAPEKVAQRINQAVLIQLHSSFERFLHSILLHASFWNAEKAREHLIEVRPEQADNIPGLNPGQLGTWAAGEVDFKKGAKRLRAAVLAILGIELFPDAETDAYCTDLIAVRNIAIHQVGQVDQANVGTVRDPGVIIETRIIGASKFYDLVVSREFLSKCLFAVSTTVLHIQSQAAKNPLFGVVTVEDLLKESGPRHGP
jgi:hypothetical protein